MEGDQTLAVHLEPVSPPAPALWGGAVNDPTFYQALLRAATHVDAAAVDARALVGDLHARPERYVRVSLF